jgi:hypothetical protein
MTVFWDVGCDALKMEALSTSETSQQIAVFVVIAVRT